MSASKANLTWSLLATSVVVIKPVSSFTFLSQSKPIAPTPSNIPGRVLGFHIPARYTVTSVSFNSCAIFLDLAKAFDSVDHEILLSKLPKYGIRGNILNFFKSYLTSRSQFVKIGRTESSALPIKFGVPQGSILGPLLFLLFINDLPNASNFFIKLFATNDTFLCAQNKDIELLETEVNHKLVKVNRWLVANKLTLNIGKSKFMIITNKKLKSYTPSVKINGKPLKCCDHYKYLGVIFDKNLCWKPHIEYICKKVSKACGSLANLRYCVNIDLLREVYHSIVHSYLRGGDQANFTYRVF